jgi:RES domain-containing protein
MNAHPKYGEIKHELTKFAREGIRFSATCYRCTEPQFAGEIVSGVGSQLHGGRWTPKGSFPTAYLCETAEAALAEFLARARRLKIPDYKSLPMIMLGVKVKVHNLLDTTEGEVRDAIGSLLEKEKIHWRSIQDRREAISQAIGRAAHEICFSGLIVESQALTGSRNIVVFPKKLSGKEMLTALPPQHLETK